MLGAKFYRHKPGNSVRIPSTLPASRQQGRRQDQGSVMGQPAVQTACVSCRAKPELDAQGDGLGRTMVTGSCPQLRRIHINSYMVQVRSSALTLNPKTLNPPSFAAPRLQVVKVKASKAPVCRETSPPAVFGVWHWKVSLPFQPRTACEVPVGPEGMCRCVALNPKP